MTELIYKILTEDQWNHFARSANFEGSEHDKQDGFIHLCSMHQLKGTLDKHYSEIDTVILVGLDGHAFDARLKWEVSRGGEKFPHLYCDLSFSALVNMHRLDQTPDGFELPYNL
ncbi:MAG: DUF952 domain-containing protein [Acidimicrobiales bacterium]|nr:DUF952 domain-containing protein [Hyphomonadaceae bacterium]RZV44173.1 MAG: DUF952 domain-containing protein [Acidimicrobiales bacterium]